MKSFKKVLVFAPHTDDGELGCGGFMSRLISEGAEVFQVALSAPAIIVEHGTGNKELEKEYKRATKKIGLKDKNVFIHHFRVRKFNESRQDILDLMIYYKRMFKPELVLVPSSKDIHQDHKIVYEEALRAYKETSIFGYELSWNTFSFNNDIYISLDERFVKNKLLACGEYKTQKFRNYMQKEHIKSILKTRGSQISKEYAECFECIRLMY